MSTRDKILSAAEKVFSTNGYYTATMDMIALEAEVAKGTLYYNFPSKSSLFTEVIKSGIQYVAQKLTAIAYSEYSPDRQVLKCIDFMADFCIENSSFVNILFFELSGGIDKDVMAMANELIADIAGIISDMIRQGIVHSVVRSMDAEIVSYALLGALQGVMGRYLRGKAPLADGDIKKVKDNLIKLFMKGLTF